MKCTYKNILLSGDNMYFGCDLSMEEYVRDFELLGYTHDEAIELGKLAIERLTTIIEPEEFDRIVEVFNNVGEVYPISAEDLKKALERYQNEHNV